MNLSKRERDTYNFIVRFILEHGYAPLLSEIAQGLGISSKGVVHRYIKALQEYQLIERSSKHRGITVNAADFQAGQIPILGNIAAGEPIEAIENKQSLDINHIFYAENRYALKIVGDSMINIGILDGDWVIIEATNSWRNKDIVVALVANNSVTLKRIEQLKNAKIRLVAENDQLPDMIYDAAEIKVQGVLKGQLRLY